jgi:hypothetical protein
VLPACHWHATPLQALACHLPAVQNKEACKGRAWVLEGDLKAGTHLRLDKTGKAILTVLRHLNRCQEVRLARLVLVRP